MRTAKIIFFINILLTTGIKLIAQPTAEFTSHEISFCQEGYALLEISFTGEGPFGVEYKDDKGFSFKQDNGGNGFHDNPVVFQHTVSESTTFTILNVWDKTGLEPGGEPTPVETDPFVVTIYQKPIIDNLFDDESCGIEYLLNPTSDIESSTYKWTSTRGSFTNDELLNTTFQGIEASVNEIYDLTLTVENGACKDDDAVTKTAEITLKGTPKGSIIEGEDLLCVPKDRDVTLNLEGNGDYSYILSNLDGDPINGAATIPNPTESITITKSDEIRITSLQDNISGCSSRAVDLSGVKVFTDETPPTFAGENSLVCGIDIENTPFEYTLEASTNSDTQGKWTSSASGITFNEDQSATSKVYSDNYQEATLTWTETTNNLGCVNSASVDIRFAESPSLNTSINDDQICENSTAVLPLTVTGNSPWSLSYNNDVETLTEDISSTNHNLLFVGSEQQIGQNNYTLTEIVGTYGCASTLNKQYDLLVDELPFPIAGADQTVCGKEVTLEAVYSGIGVGVWQGKGTFEDPGDPNTKFTALNFQEEPLAWVEINGQCIVEDIVNVNFLKAPFPVNAGNDTAIYASTSLVLNALPLSTGSGKWDVTLGNAVIAEPNNPKSSVSNLTRGTHILTWTGSIDESTACESISDELIIESNEIIAPSGISPNGDGLNDMLKILGAENINNNKLSVFNNNGKLVYSTKNYQNDWYGVNSSGGKLEAGTYYYIFEGEQLSKPIRNYLIIKYDN